MSESGSGKKTRSFSTLRMTRCWTIYWWEGQKKAFKFELNGMLLWCENGRNLLCDENDDEDGRWLGLFGALASTANVIAMTSKEHNTTDAPRNTLHWSLSKRWDRVWRRRNARRVRAKNFSPLLRTLLLLCCTSSAVLVPFLTKASTDRTLRKNLSQSSAEPPWFPTWEALHLVDVKIVWIRKRLILDYFQHDLTHQCDPKNWRNPSHSRMCDSCPSAAKKTDNFYPPTD